MNDEIKEILDRIETASEIFDCLLKPKECTELLNYITNLQQENERLKKEVAKLHIIQEEYGNHIENAHIIDDYQKTYFMCNKWLIELKNGKFVYIDELNDKYEDYKSRCEKINEILKESPDFNYSNDYIILKRKIESILQGENNE